MKNAGLASFLLLLFCVLAMMAFVFLPVLTEPRAVPKGDVLTYEVDPEFLSKGQSVDMDRLTQIVDSRLNSGPGRLAHVRKLDDRRIEIALMRRDDDDKQRVQRLLVHTGTLEFRILANARDNKELIERAQGAPSMKQVLDGNGNLLAWWVPVKSRGEEGFANYPEIARRTTKKGDQEIIDVLVVKDPYDVTSAYLVRAEAGSDQKGKPCVHLALSKAGGQLFGSLTGDHLPDKATNFTYKLGIILDNELYSAPAIRGQIFNYAELNGSFTQKEVQDLVGAFNSGSLPARIRLVERKDAP